HALRGLLEESHFLRRRGAHSHRLPEGWPCDHVRDGRVTGDARRLRLSHPELFSLDEPFVHPFVQVSRGSFSIPAASRSPILLRGSPTSGACEDQEYEEEGNADEAQNRNERRAPRSLC